MVKPTPAKHEVAMKESFGEAVDRGLHRKVLERLLLDILKELRNMHLTLKEKKS